MAFGHKATAAEGGRKTNAARSRLDAWLARRLPSDDAHPHRLEHATRVSDALVFLLAAYVGFLSMQVPSAQLAAFVTNPWCLALNLAIELLAMAALYFLFQRRVAGPRVVLVALCVLGIAQRYVIAFRGSAITPVDLYALGTAAAVAGQYDYTPDVWCLVGVALCVVAWKVLSLVHERPSGGRHPVARNLAGALACAAALAAGTTLPSYAGQLGVWLNQWHINECYQQQGFFPVFIAAAQDMVLVEPDGYDEQAAAADERALAGQWERGDGSSEARAEATAQFDETRPSVVVIMNESFSDISTFGVVEGYDGPTYVRDELAADSILSGRLSVSVNGGGTCNSEFEFLTGLPMAFLGTRKYPYVQYNFSQTDNLARQFGSWGYDTTAIHPNLANNWSRKKVYGEMGFDRFLSIDDFPGARHYHNGVADGETYDKILDILRSDDDPQFVFDVTMQNHSGYDVGNIPAKDRTDYRIPGLYTTDQATVNEYIACVNASERDLRSFIDELRELDRPVIVVFYGDHQPYFTDWFRAGGPQNSNVTPSQLEREYETLYDVWANYDVAGTTRGTSEQTSVSYLSSVVLDTVGAPLSDYQESLLELRHDLLTASCFVIEDPDGRWHWLDDGVNEGVPKATVDARDRLHMIAYRRYELLKN